MKWRKVAGKFYKRNWEEYLNALKDHEITSYTGIWRTKVYFCFEGIKHQIWSSPLMMIPVYSNKNIASNSFTRSILHKNLGPPERQINIKLSTVFASVPGLLNSFSKFNSAMVRGGSRDFEKGWCSMSVTMVGRQIKF